MAVNSETQAEAECKLHNRFKKSITSPEKIDYFVLKIRDKPVYSSKGKKSPCFGTYADPSRKQQKVIAVYKFEPIKNVDGNPGSHYAIYVSDQVKQETPNLYGFRCDVTTNTCERRYDLDGYGQMSNFLSLAKSTQNPPISTLPSAVQQFMKSQYDLRGDEVYESATERWISLSSKIDAYLKAGKKVKLYWYTKSNSSNAQDDSPEFSVLDITRADDITTYLHPLMASNPTMNGVFLDVKSQQVLDDDALGKGKVPENIVNAAKASLRESIESSKSLSSMDRDFFQGKTPWAPASKLTPQSTQSMPLPLTVRFISFAKSLLGSNYKIVLDRTYLLRKGEELNDVQIAALDFTVYAKATNASAKIAFIEPDTNKLKVYDPHTGDVLVDDKLSKFILDRMKTTPPPPTSPDPRLVASLEEFTKNQRELEEGLKGLNLSNNLKALTGGRVRGQATSCNAKCADGHRCKNSKGACPHHNKQTRRPVKAK